MITTVCVFCGSSSGTRAEYMSDTRGVGRALAEAGVRLVYGGGKVGLMGTVAQACLDAGGQVIGVIPEALATKELAHTGLTELHIVGSMHQRKAMMADLSDAFVALPGGLGTFEELFEVLTWGQLGIHAKPCAVMNTLGYYDPLLAQADRAVDEGFLKRAHRAAILEVRNPGDVLKALKASHPVQEPKWISPSQT